MADETGPPNQGAPGTPPWLAEAAPEADGDAFSERPEVFVGAAFAGGLVLAQILKRFGRD